jgi:hypothetical protein
MKTRLASVAAALALVLGSSLTPALAQGYGADDPRRAVRGGYVLDLDTDDLVTGSIVRHGGDRSAKEGNAEQNNKPSANYGNTSGGPAY